MRAVSDSGCRSREFEITIAARIRAMSYACRSNHNLASLRICVLLACRSPFATLIESSKFVVRKTPCVNFELVRCLCFLTSSLPPPRNSRSFAFCKKMLSSSHSDDVTSAAFALFVIRCGV